MRLVQLTIPTGAREKILETLDSEGVDYVVTDETSGREYTGVVYFPLPAPAVEPVLDALQEEGIEDDAYTVVVDAETVISRKFDALREEYENGDVEEDRISRQELRTHAEELTPTFSVYVTLTVVSALVATAGLLLDSPAVVVGSMVIAPLIGPALGASIGTVLDERELLVSGAKHQILGVVLAISSAAVMAWFVRVTNVVPPGMDIAAVDEIAERLAPDLLSLVIALGAGVAGILSISTGVSVALVGVMIAAALIPPAAAAGIAIAFGQPTAAIGSTVLVFVNVLSVNLAGLVTLWYAGYRPERLFDRAPTQKRVRRQIVGLALVVLVFSMFLGGITYGSYLTGSFEQNAREEVETTFDEEYPQFRVIDLEVTLDDDYPFRGPDRVVVTIAGPPDGSSSVIVEELHDRLRERINQHTDDTVVVELRFVNVVEG
ncbi:TIGR00341 family protein [Halobacteria archaeon AArc-m2/3/4]|uniref:TIGR00341 family protein n=1 Tax=Natronoglomus mannanivorans TaxID=2979990 RepID=A0AAP2Z3H8_9EURY|nr:TIGR00341 family protein [Halobacteria archaeon AArc-xg1-1]MCU4974414.1 TIGR00341 family protein [Halobacteria archaeon AArc-m2/3/4]